MRNDEKTVVVNPPAGSTTVVDPNGDAHVQKPNNYIRSALEFEFDRFDFVT